MPHPVSQSPDALKRAEFSEYVGDKTTPIIINSSTPLGFIGLGSTGESVALNLVKSGNYLSVLTEISSPACCHEAA
jgi:hypothetical protein